MRLDHLLSKEKEKSFEASYFRGNFKIARGKFIVYFSMYFLSSTLNLKSEGSQKKEELEKYSKIWAHSSDG